MQNLKFKNTLKNTYNNKCENKIFEIHNLNIKRKISNETIIENNELTEEEFSLSNLLKKRDKPLQKKINPLRVYTKNYAKDLNGKYIRKLDNKNYFLFQCGLDHKFILTKKQIVSGVWCTTCDKILKNIDRFVKNRNGVLISKKLDKNISLQCEHGHIFMINYKKVKLRWCKECSKNNKKILKRMIELENLKIEEERRRKQNVILEEAKQKYLQRKEHLQAHKGFTTQNTEKILKEVENLAIKYTNNYFNKKREKSLLEEEETEEEEIKNGRRVGTNLLIEKNVNMISEGYSSYKKKSSLWGINNLNFINTTTTTTTTTKNVSYKKQQQEQQNWQQQESQFKNPLKNNKKTDDFKIVEEKDEDVKQGNNYYTNQGAEKNEMNQDNIKNIMNQGSAKNSMNQGNAKNFMNRVSEKKNFGSEKKEKNLKKKKGCCCKNNICCCLEKDFQYQQIKEMFKLIIMPIPCMENYFRQMTKENLKKEFKRCALFVHPDKNNHPNAKVAFQKLFKYFLKEMEFKR